MKDDDAKIRLFKDGWEREEEEDQTDEDALPLDLLGSFIFLPLKYALE